MNKCHNCGHEEDEVQVAPLVLLAVAFSLAVMPFIPTAGGPAGVVGGLLGLLMEIRRLRHAGAQNR
jgi:hypothetical protein